MPIAIRNGAANQMKSMHTVGVICGLAAGVWLGGAEAPTKLVSVNISPFAISFCMVAGAFVARWTIPSLLKGTDYIFVDICEKKHLTVWGILAGALWAVANTLTVFAIRDVGLAIAFPLWNTNCLIAVFWGWLLFRELHGAPARNWLKVLGGTLAILLSAFLLAFSSIHGAAVAPAHGAQGVVAALAAGLMWGTMYVPYRKAYLSGMNPLSFVTVFTVGELATMGLLTAFFYGGIHPLIAELQSMRTAIFWLFLGGFCWVIGDLFQQYATKYIGIGRAIPLSNTNQLWGLAWGALVFGELGHADLKNHLIVVAASFVMLLGALGISTSAAAADEQVSTKQAIARECKRYALDYSRVLATQSGVETKTQIASRRWWDYLIAITSLGIFAWLATDTTRPPLTMNVWWVWILLLLLVLTFLSAGWWLWRKTRFS